MVFRRDKKFNMNLARGPLDFAVLLLLYITTLEIKYNHKMVDPSNLFFFPGIHQVLP